MAKKPLKYLCVYNVLTREVLNDSAIEIDAPVSSELKDWFDFHSKDEPEPLLWEYEKARYESSAFGQGSANGWRAFCGDEAFTWETYDKAVAEAKDAQEKAIAEAKAKETV